MATIYKLFTIFMSILLLTNFEVESKRNYKHSKQELKLIKNVVIDQDQCDKHEIPIVIHSAAQSSGKYFERRQTTRNTWAKEAKKYQMRPLFVMGLATDERTQEELEKEAQHFKDIIQFGFIDNYYNLTLKSLSMLRWIRKNCFTSAYVLKTDDDVLVNIPLLHKMFMEKKFGDGLTGKMLIEKSNRIIGNKWFMPSNVYKQRYYRFLYGFSYVMSKNSVKQMYRKAVNFSQPVLDIDDLFMTGVLAKKARVRLFSDKRFDFYCGYEGCFINKMVAVHGCESVNQTETMWNYWKHLDKKQCNKTLVIGHRQWGVPIPGGKVFTTTKDFGPFLPKKWLKFPKFHLGPWKRPYILVKVPTFHSQIYNKHRRLHRFPKHRRFSLVG